MLCNNSIYQSTDRRQTQAAKSIQQRRKFVVIGLFTALLALLPIVALVAADEGPLKVTIFTASAQSDGSDEFAVILRLQPDLGSEITPSAYANALQAQLTDDFSAFEGLEIVKPKSGAGGDGDSLTYEATFSEAVPLDEIAESVTEALTPIVDPEVNIITEEEDSNDASNEQAQLTEED